ncbi:MAG: hypothetical protein DRM97_04395, partial [Thermoprotei archaeon]
ILASFVGNFWIQTLTEWWAFPGVLPPPIILVIIVSELLGWVNPKWRLTAAELTVLTTTCLMCAGVTYIQYGQLLWGISCVPTYHFFMPLYAAENDPYKAWWDIIPEFWIPKDKNIVDAAWYGLAWARENVGIGEVPWGAWGPSLVYWILFFLLWTITGYFWGFMLRKPFIEVERLPFPAVLPTAYLIQWASEIDPEKNRTKLFDLRIPRNKLFWVFFILGFLGTLPDVFRYFIPAIPPSTEWSTQPVDLSPYTTTLFPGGFAFAYLMIPEIPIFFLCPLDILATTVLTWFIFAFLYPVVGVKLGILEYRPGVESMYMGIMAGYYGRNGPFKYWYWATSGITLGIGVWVLITTYKHLATIFKCAFGKEDIKEQGVSYRLVAWGTIILCLLWLAMWVGSGVPVHVAIFVLLTYWLFQIANIRGSAELWRHYTVYQLFGTPYVYAMLGAPAIPTTDPTMIKSIFLVCALGNAGPRLSPFNIRTTIYMYKVAEVNKVRAADVFWAMIITAIVAGIWTHVFGLWWIHHLGGLSKLGPVPYHEWALGWAQNYTLTTPEFTIPEYIHLTWTGIVFVIIVYLLRMRFPWFFWNPVAMMMTLFVMEWMWLNCLIALIIKVIVFRVGGAKLYEERAVPAAIGFAMGYGFNFFITAVLQFCLRAWPMFWARLV